MGAEQSTIDNTTSPSIKNTEELSVEDVFGFQVLKVKPYSPAHDAKLLPFFDFIVAIEGEETIETIKQFSLCINKYKDSECKLHVYSVKTNKLRQIILKPRLDWSPKNNEGLLGCSIRFCSILKGIESVWRILEISENSPAQKAGLNPFIDYVIGCEYRNLINEPDFYNLIKNYEDKVLTLLVYNSEWDTCRDVIIIPKSDWGGEGLLGCGVGYGYLHRVPVANNKDEEVEANTLPTSQHPPSSNKTFPILNLDGAKNEEKACNSIQNQKNELLLNSEAENVQEKIAEIQIDDENKSPEINNQNSETQNILETKSEIRNIIQPTKNENEQEETSSLAQLTNNADKDSTINHAKNSDVNEAHKDDDKKDTVEHDSTQSKDAPIVHKETESTIPISSTGETLNAHNSEKETLKEREGFATELNEKEDGVKEENTEEKAGEL